MKVFYVFLTLILVTACADGITVPVTGKIGSQTAQGQATAKFSGEGTFWVSTIDGLQCSGTYNSMDRSPTISTPVICNDGRKGNLLITRTMDGISGTVVGKLNDGTRGQFVFGNLTFDQAFGNGGAKIR